MVSVHSAFPPKVSFFAFFSHSFYPKSKINCSESEQRIVDFSARHSHFHIFLTEQIAVIFNSFMFLFLHQLGKLLPWVFVGSERTQHQTTWKQLNPHIAALFIFSDAKQQKMQQFSPVRPQCLSVKGFLSSHCHLQKQKIPSGFKFAY